MGHKQQKGEKRCRRLHGNSGETLAEMMASIVITSLSVALLFSAVIATTGIDRRTREEDEEYYEALSAAEAGRKAVEKADDNTDGNSEEEEAALDGTVIITGGGIDKKELKIRFYGGKGIYAYRLVEEGAGEEPPESGSEEVLP